MMQYTQFLAHDSRNDVYFVVVAGSQVHAYPVEKCENAYFVKVDSHHYSFDEFASNAAALEFVHDNFYDIVSSVHDADGITNEDIILYEMNQNEKNE